MLFEDSDQIDDLKEFMQMWYKEYKKEYGIRSKEIPTYLPKALRDLYAFAGRWKCGKEGKGDLYKENSPEIFQQQDVLYRLEDIKEHNGMLLFLSENQDVFSCMVEKGNEYSPVYSNSMELTDENKKGYQKVNDSLFHFLKTFCLREMLMGCDEVEMLSDDRAQMQDIKNGKGIPIWINACYVYPKEEGASHDFWLMGADQLVMWEYGSCWIGYVRRKEEKEKC